MGITLVKQVTSVNFEQCGNIVCVYSHFLSLVTGLSVSQHKSKRRKYSEEGVGECGISGGFALAIQATPGTSNLPLSASDNKHSLPLNGPSILNLDAARSDKMHKGATCFPFAAGLAGNVFLFFFLFLSVNVRRQRLHWSLLHLSTCTIRPFS